MNILFLRYNLINCVGGEDSYFCMTVHNPMEMDDLRQAFMLSAVLDDVWYRSTVNLYNNLNNILLYDIKVILPFYFLVCRVSGLDNSIKLQFERAHCKSSDAETLMQTC